QAFVDFANKVPFYGAVIACADDANLRDVVPRMTRRVTTYALDADADVTATDVVLGPLMVEGTVKCRARRASDRGTALATFGSIVLHVPGRHNLQNALAAVAVGMELGLSFEQIAVG